MLDEMTHEIVDVYLVKCDKGVLALCSEKEVEKYVNIGVEKGVVVTSKKITTNITRVNEIGNNIFKVNYPCTTKDELIEFRNKVVTDWFNRCQAIKNSNKSVIWNKVAESYNVPFITPEGFSQSILDKIEFI